MAKQKNPYEIDFEEYIRHTDASKKDKTLAWSTAIGLQQVDGLKPSSYLYETAKKKRRWLGLQPSVCSKWMDLLRLRICMKPQDAISKATFLLTKQKDLSIHIIKKRLREIQMKTNERKKPIKSQAA